MKSKRIYLILSAIAVVIIAAFVLTKLIIAQKAFNTFKPNNKFVIYNTGKWKLEQANLKLFDKKDIDLKRVHIIVGGNKLNVVTDKKYVGDILRDNGIIISSKDEITPFIWNVVRQNDTIKVCKVQEKIDIKNIPIPFGTTTTYTDRLDRGKSQVVRDGVSGVKELKYSVILKDGKEVARKLISQKVIKNAVNKVVALGTIATVQTSRGDVIRYRRVLTMEATGYNESVYDTGKSPGDAGYGMTAIGMRVRHGVVAVDPNVISLGTRLYVENYGYAVAADTGGAIKGNRIDLYFDSRDKARRFGRQIVRVYILR